VKHKSPPTLVAEMDRRFRLNESVIRHLTVIAPKESPKVEETKTGEDGEKAAAATPAVGE